VVGSHYAEGEPQEESVGRRSMPNVQDSRLGTATPSEAIRRRDLGRLRTPVRSERHMYQDRVCLTHRPRAATAGVDRGRSWWDTSVADKRYLSEEGHDQAIVLLRHPEAEELALLGRYLHANSIFLEFYTHNLYEPLLRSEESYSVPGEEQDSWTVTAKRRRANSRPRLTCCGAAGRRAVRSPCAKTRHLTPMQYLSEAVVVEPEELRREVYGQASDLLEAYGAGA
jgi:hypothetical protein